MIKIIVKKIGIFYRMFNQRYSEFYTLDSRFHGNDAMLVDLSFLRKQESRTSQMKR